MKSGQDAGIFGSLRALRRQLWIVVAVALAVAGVALGLSLLQQREYTASASLLFRDPQFDDALFKSSFTSSPADAARAAATNAQLVSLDVVAERTARELGGGLTTAQVADSVSVTPEQGADLVEVSATDVDPADAASLANTFAGEYIQFRRQADRSKIEQARSLISRELRDSQTSPVAKDELRRRQQQLSILAALQTGNAELVQPADRPSNPSSPKPVRNAVLGLILGLLLGIAVALIRHRVDRRLRDLEEIEEVFQRPVLGAVRESHGVETSGDPQNLQRVDADAFRMISANLRYFDVDRDVKSLVVTSAQPGDGKTTVALNLARIAAAGGVRVLLVECDLRHPALAARIGLPSDKGLSTALAGDVPIADLVKQTPVDTRTDGKTSDRSLDVLVCGPLPPNPADLIESHAMIDLLHRAEREYELVVLDTPPTSIVSDAIPLLKEVSGVIVVARLGWSSRDGAVRLRDQLNNLRAPLLGVVVNSIQPKAAGYGYRYGYSYGEDEASSSSNGGGAPSVASQSS